MSLTADDLASKHTIPVIDRMMDILGEIERHEAGVSIRDLTETLNLPRTTIYRILNTLQGHDVVRRGEDGTYRLGRRILSLAAHVTSRGRTLDLAAFTQPFLDKLAADLGEGVKLSVIDDGGILVLTASQGRREYALTVAPGQRMPIHAGAASKMLLAHLDPGDLDFWLDRTLTAFTAKTLTDPKRLRSELARIKRLGWAQDKGENAPSIQAFAAPVFDKGGNLMAAVSVPFLAGTEPIRMEEIRTAVIETARAISQSMPI